MEKQQKYRMYDNPILELLSKSGPIMMTSIHLLIAGSLVIKGIQSNPTVTLFTGTVFFCFGILTWTLTEYLMHRFVFHWIAPSKTGKAFHYALHGYHHDNPTDYNRLFIPPVPAILFLLLFFGIFYLFMGNMAWFFTPGFEIGYLIYSLMHYFMHTKVKLPFMYFMSFHHHLHHYRMPEKAFGVSSRFWDRVFRTMP